MPCTHCSVHLCVLCAMPCTHCSVQSMCFVYNALHTLQCSVHVFCVRCLAHTAVFSPCVLCTMPCHTAVFSPCVLCAMPCTHCSIQSMCFVYNALPHCSVQSMCFVCDALHTLQYSVHVFCVQCPAQSAVFSPCVLCSMPCHTAVFSPCVLCAMPYTRCSIQSMCFVCNALHTLQYSVHVFCVQCPAHTAVFICVFCVQCPAHTAVFSPCVLCTMPCHTAVFSPCVLCAMPCHTASHSFLSSLN